MPMPVSAFACGQPMPSKPPLVVVVVVRVPADRPEGDEAAATEEPIHLDIGLALPRLHKAPLAPATRKNYAGALRRLDAWLDGRPVDDAMLKAYFDELFDRDLAPSCRSLRLLRGGRVSFGSGFRWASTPPCRTRTRPTT